MKGQRDVGWGMLDGIHAHVSLHNRVSLVQKRARQMCQLESHDAINHVPSGPSRR